MYEVVSIHAPGRGATTCSSRTIISPCRFNSRTREGCDLEIFSRISFELGFNSRTREGCDWYKGVNDVLNNKFQFTHPGGVRPTYRALLGAPPRFNSRTREGCDIQGRLLHASCLMFQFTHPGGVRLPCGAVNSVVPWFQFTHPGGVRRKVSARDYDR